MTEHFSHPADLAILRNGGVQPDTRFREYDCSICCKATTGDEKGFGLAVPMGDHGEPILSNEEAGIYASVCPVCYARWENWDRLKGN